MCAVIAKIQEQVAEGKSLLEAAIYVNNRNEALCFEVMEHIGNWPSSEPELRALQKVWP